MYTVKEVMESGSIAVIGASHDPTKLGYGLARNLIQSNYKGAVHLINPRGGSLFGQTACPVSQHRDIAG